MPKHTKKEKQKNRTEKVRARGGAGTKFSIGSKKLSKKEFGQAKSKLGFSGGERTKGVDTTKADEAIASRTFPKKIAEEKKKAEEVKKKTTEEANVKKAEGGFLQESFGGQVDEQGQPIDLGITNEEAIGLGLAEGITGADIASQDLEALALGAGSTPTAVAGVKGTSAALRAGEKFVADAKARKAVVKAVENGLPTTEKGLTELGVNLIKAKGAKKDLFGKTAVGLGALYGINEFVLSPSELATWAAVDNVAGQAAFLIRDVVGSVKFNGMSLEEAQVQIKASKESVAGAKKFVGFSTVLNPKLWAVGKQLRNAIREAERRIEFSEIELIQLTGGQTNE